MCEGADEIRLDEEGNLLICTPYGTVVDLKPIAYQVTGDVRTTVDCRYVIDASSGRNWTVGFEMTEAYNSGLPLIIDPVIFYSTYLGGTEGGDTEAIAVDASGHAYVTGAFGVGFPVTPGAFQTTFAGETSYNFV